MAETKAERYERKVEFVARRLAEEDGRVWERLPERSAWRADKRQYRSRATVACGAAALWDMVNDYREARSDA